MTAKLVLFAAFVISMLLMSINHKKRRKKIVFFGDSITEFGVSYTGYISLLRALLQAIGESDDYELVGAGVAGDKVEDLYRRMDGDILANGADLVVVFIGINDIAYKLSALTAPDIAQFEAVYISIIEKLHAAGIKVVVCTPSVLGENIGFNSPEDKEINLYSDVIRKLADQYDLPLVDIREAFINYLAANNTAGLQEGILTTDKIHLNHKGNQLVAEEIWKVLQQVKLP